MRRSTKAQEIWCRAVTARLVCASIVVLLLTGLLSAAASAQLQLVPNRFAADSYRTDGITPDTRAGAHPFQASTSFEIALQPGGRAVGGYARNIEVKLPPGFIGNPQAATKCSRATFDALILGTATCPATSQVGVAEVGIMYFGARTHYAPVFNVEPFPGQTADFGIPILFVQAHVVATVDTAGNYGLRADLSNLSQGLPLFFNRLSLWGVPHDPSHDAQRSCGTVIVPEPVVGTPCPVGAPRKPFLTNPTECAGPLTSNIRINSWETPEIWEEASFTTEKGIDECDRLRFEPSITVRSDSQRAGAPAAYSIDIDIPQNDDPDGLGTPPLRDAVVTLPAGTSISPSGGEGMLGCSDERIALRSMREPDCPQESRLGTIEVTTPLLEKPMTGEVYLGEPQRGNLFRLYLVLRGPGLIIKLPGTARPDQSRGGQIVTTFDENPPLPFSNMHLEFKGSPRAPLSNPTKCGPATATASMTAWGVDKPAEVNSTFQITQRSDGSPCRPRGFEPRFVAGLQNPNAGGSSTFSLTFGRGDDDQELRDVTVDMPEGVTGVLAAATLCDEGPAAAGTCGEASRVGSVTTEAGPGAFPVQVPGRVYLTGPYNGAPIGLSIVVPAVVGPFDLGTVVVRAAVHVDKHTTKLRVVSDPMPTILEGVPLQIRTINVRIDKPGFILSPTRCEPSSIAARIGSTEGANVTRSNRFQVANCAVLPFAPKMRLVVGKAGRTSNDASTPLSVTLAMSRGQANNRSVEVTLPSTINARLPIINRACTRQEYEQERCAKARSGSAVATTPLLRDPLRGSAYFVRNPSRRLPDLVVQLRGQVDVELVGRVSIVNSRLLRTTFDFVPDVPVSKFRLDLVAGRQGPLGVVGNLCRARTRARTVATLNFTGQNGAKIERKQRVSVRGCGGKSRSTQSRRGGRAGKQRRSGRSGKPRANRRR